MVSRQSAVRSAVAGFFLLAGVSGLYGADSLDCGLRGLAGAGLMYVMTIVVGRLTDIVAPSVPPRQDQQT